MPDTTVTHYSTRAKLSLAEAISAALAAHPGIAYKAKLKEKHGELAYKISIARPDGGAVEVRIDPATGAVAGVKDKKPKAGE